MRFRLRTLLILLLIGPPMLAVALGVAVDTTVEVMERRSVFLISVWVISLTAIIFFDWRRTAARKKKYKRFGSWR